MERTNNLMAGGPRSPISDIINQRNGVQVDDLIDTDPFDITFAETSSLDILEGVFEEEDSFAYGSCGEPTTPNTPHENALEAIREVNLSVSLTFGRTHLHNVVFDELDVYASVSRGHSCCSLFLGADGLFDYHNTTGWVFPDIMPCIVVSDCNDVGSCSLAYNVVELPGVDHPFPVPHVPSEALFYGSEVYACWETIPLKNRPGHQFFKKLMPSFHDKEATKLSIRYDFDTLLRLLYNIDCSYHLHAYVNARMEPVGDKRELLFVMTAWYFAGVDVAFYYHVGLTKCARPYGLPAGVMGIVKCRKCNEVSRDSATKICNNPKCVSNRGKGKVVKCYFCNTRMRQEIYEGKPLQICPSAEAGLCELKVRYCGVHKTKFMKIYRGEWRCYLCDTEKQKPLAHKQEKPLPDNYMDVFDEDVPEPGPVIEPPVIVEPVVVAPVAAVQKDAPRSTPPAKPTRPPPPPPGTFGPKTLLEEIPVPQPRRPKEVREAEIKAVNLKKKQVESKPKDIRFRPVQVPVVETCVGSFLKLRLACFIVLSMISVPILIIASTPVFICTWLVLYCIKNCYSWVIGERLSGLVKHQGLKFACGFLLPLISGWLLRMFISAAVMDGLSICYVVTQLLCLCILFKMCIFETNYKLRLVFRTYQYLKEYNHVNPEDGRVDAVKIGDAESNPKLQFWKLHDYKVSESYCPHLLVFFCWCVSFTLTRASSVVDLYQRKTGKTPIKTNFKPKIHTTLDSSGDENSIAPGRCQTLFASYPKEKRNSIINKGLSHLGVRAVFDGRRFSYSPIVTWTEETVIISEELYCQLTSIDKMNHTSDIGVVREIMTRSASRNTKINLDKRLTVTTGRSVADDTMSVALAFCEQWQLLNNSSLFQ